MPQKTRHEVQQKFENADYPIQVVGRHIHITEPMKQYAIEKLSKVEHLGGHVIDATIIMDIQKINHIVDFLLNVNGSIIKVSSITTDMYASVDQAIHKLKLKLARYLDKLHTHHKRKSVDVQLPVSIIQRDHVDEINEAIEEENSRQIESIFKPGEVVAKEQRALKILTQEEAVMKMDLSEDAFMVYRSEKDQRLKVIYRHSDPKHYGIIELPE